MATHVKFYSHSSKGVVKEIRRIGFQDASDDDWKSLQNLVANLFAIPEYSITYEDNEKDTVVLESQVEWDECLRMGPYTVHEPLRLHIKRRCGKPMVREEKQPKKRPGVLIEPSHFYTTDGKPMPKDFERFKDLVPEVVRPYLTLCQGEGCPEWLRSAMEFVPVDGGEIDLHINIDRLAACLSQQALNLMESNIKEYAEALTLLTQSHLLKPTPQKEYNIGCCHALMSNPAEAVDALQRAVDLGYHATSFMLGDEDLASLHDDPRFQVLVQTMLTQGPSSDCTSLAPIVAEEAPATASDTEGTVARDHDSEVSYECLEHADSAELVEAEVAPEVVQQHEQEQRQEAEQLVQQEPETQSVVEPLQDSVVADTQQPTDAEEVKDAESLTDLQRECIYKLHEMGFLDDVANLQALKDSDWVLTASVSKLLV